MAWYQSETVIPEWKKLLQKPNLETSELLNSQQFIIQLTKHGHPDILAWIQTNYQKFFEFLLSRSLILPNKEDSKQRKYKQPSQSISLLCSVLDVIGHNNTSTINSSISGSMMYSAASNGKISSPHIILFIIEKMFIFYFQNDPSLLKNTLIPGHFSRIFDCLNKSHSILFIQSVKSQHIQKIQKLLQLHGKLQQIIKCIETVLLVFINQAPVNINMQVSLTFQSNPVSNYSNAVNFQQNYPYEVKFKLLKYVLHKLKSYCSLEVEVLENILSLIFEILKNANVIFEGNFFVDYICEAQNINSFFQIGFNKNQASLEIRIKSFDILKHSIHFIPPFQRNQLLHRMETLINEILKEDKATLMVCSMVEFLNEWFLVETGQVVNINNNRSSINVKESLNGQKKEVDKQQMIKMVERIMKKHKLFKHLINVCVRSRNCNIFHQRVAYLIISVFKSQNIQIINSIFQDNEIIRQTLVNMTDFKQNPYFGYFIMIVEAFTTRRVNTAIVSQVLDRNTQLWNQFYVKILEPHFSQRLGNKLGEMQNVNDPPPIDFSSSKHEAPIKVYQSFAEKQKQQPKFDTSAEKEKQISFESQLSISPIKLNKQKNDNEQKGKPSDFEGLEPISLKFTKKQTETPSKQGEKSETESFKTFLKRKMQESNKLVDQRRKSKTPGKIITGQSKKKKWGNDEQSNSSSARKAVSVEEKHTNKRAEPFIEIELQKILFLKAAQNKLTKKLSFRERKINKQKDHLLIKWLEKVRNNSKKVL